MARYDKYSGVTGGFRARLAADINVANTPYDTVQGVGLDASGLAVVGAAGVSGFTGVTVVDATMRKAGTPIDIMTDGEIVEVEGTVAGTTYYLDANGDLTDVAPAAGVNAIKVGHTVEADRLVVRIQEVQGA